MVYETKSQTPHPFSFNPSTIFASSSNRRLIPLRLPCAPSAIIIPELHASHGTVRNRTHKQHSPNSRDHTSNREDEDAQSRHDERLISRHDEGLDGWNDFGFGGNGLFGEDAVDECGFVRREGSVCGGAGGVFACEGDDWDEDFLECVTGSY